MSNHNQSFEIEGVVLMLLCAGNMVITEFPMVSDGLGERLPHKLLHHCQQAPRTGFFSANSFLVHINDTALVNGPFHHASLKNNF